MKRTQILRSPLSLRKKRDFPREKYDCPLASQNGITCTSMDKAEGAFYLSSLRSESGARFSAHSSWEAGNGLKQKRWLMTHSDTWGELLLPLAC